MITSNCSSLKTNEAFNDNMHKTGFVQHIIENYGILDSGSMVNFIALKANDGNKHPTKILLNIGILNFAIIHFMQEYEIDWPLLPGTAFHGTLLDTQITYLFDSTVQSLMHS